MLHNKPFVENLQNAWHSITCFIEFSEQSYEEVIIVTDYTGGH